MHLKTTIKQDIDFIVEKMSDYLSCNPTDLAPAAFRLEQFFRLKITTGQQNKFGLEKSLVDEIAFPSLKPVSEKLSAKEIAGALYIGTKVCRALLSNQKYWHLVSDINNCPEENASFLIKMMAFISIKRHIQCNQDIKLDGKAAMNFLGYSVFAFFIILLFAFIFLY